MNASSLASPLRGSLNIALSGGFLAVLLSSLTSTGSAAPAVSSPAISSIESTEAVATASVTLLDGGRGLERGFVYAVAATNADPVIGGPGVSKVSKSGGIGIVSSALTGLSPATTYAVKSFSRTDLATGYSSVVFFTTDTTIEFTSGIGVVTGRSIGGGENQMFDLHIPDSSSVAFTGTGAPTTLNWQLIDVLGSVVVSGTGNVNFSGPLAWGDYRIAVSNPTTSSETFSLDLNISTLADPRVDISVGTDANATSGIDIYNTPPLAQYAVTTTTKAAPRDIYFRVDNDGTLPDSMRIAASPSDDLFKVSYWVGGLNQTAAAIVGVASTPRLTATDTPVLVRVRISPNKKDSRIRDRRVVSGRSVIVYGSESFIGTMTVTASTDVNNTDTATFRLNTLP